MLQSCGNYCSIFTHLNPARFNMGSKKSQRTHFLESDSFWIAVSMGSVETAARYLQISWDPRIPFQENKMIKTEKKLFCFSWTFSELRDSSTGSARIPETNAIPRKTELSQKWETALLGQHGSRKPMQTEKDWTFSELRKICWVSIDRGINCNPRERLNLLRTERQLCWVSMDPGIYCNPRERLNFLRTEEVLLGQHGSRNLLHPRGRLNFLRTEGQLCWVCMDPGIHCTLEKDWTFSELRMICWVSIDREIHCRPEEDWTFSELRDSSAGSAWSP